MPTFSAEVTRGYNSNYNVWLLENNQAKKGQSYLGFADICGFRKK